jgi:hypothetical protein
MYTIETGGVISNCTGVQDLTTDAAQIYRCPKKTIIWHAERIGNKSHLTTVWAYAPHAHAAA